jgi:hypothetical protein
MRKPLLSRRSMTHKIIVQVRRRLKSGGGKSRSINIANELFDSLQRCINNGKKAISYWHFNFLFSFITCFLLRRSWRLQFSCMIAKYKEGSMTINLFALRKTYDSTLGMEIGEASAYKSISMLSECNWYCERLNVIYHCCINLFDRFKVHDAVAYTIKDEQTMWMKKRKAIKSSSNY